MYNEMIITKNVNENKVLCFIFQSENLENTVIIPDIKLHSNPSAFNIYCNVRHCVLEWQKKEASLAAASRNSVQSGESDSDEEEESRELPIKLPKVSHRTLFRCIAYECSGHQTGTQTP